MRPNRWIAALALACICGPACAQYYCSPQDPNYNYCAQQEQWRKDEEARKQRDEAEYQDRQREQAAESENRRLQSQREEQAGQLRDADAQLKALRAKLLALPPLLADRNPLLGRWRVAGNVSVGGGNDLAQLMGMLSNPGAAVCEFTFGGGITEFLSDSWSSLDSSGNDSLGPIQYRKQGKQIFAIPALGVPLLGFDIVDNDTIREFRVENCNLVRVVAKSAAAAAPAPAPAIQSPARVIQAPAPAAKVAAPVASARAVGKPIDPDSPLGRGVRLHGEKDFQPALQQLLMAAKSSPNDARVYVYVADTYDWLGMRDESNQAAERAKQLDPAAFDILR